MKLYIEGETVKISDVKELSAINANSVRDQTRAAMLDGVRNVEIDLSHTSNVDSCGLGTLIALHKTACGRKGVLRLLNPQPAVQQILELTRMHRLFEIVNQHA